MDTGVNWIDFDKINSIFLCQNKETFDEFFMKL
jgi:hypothetical protein